VTLADRIADVLVLEPMAECALATEVRKRRCEVCAALEADTRFRHNGLKARASRWELVPSTRSKPEDDGRSTMSTEELAERLQMPTGRLAEMLAESVEGRNRGASRGRLAAYSLRRAGFRR